MTGAGAGGEDLVVPNKIVRIRGLLCTLRMRGEWHAL